MTFRGTIQNGKVVFDEPISLPDGTPVRVEQTRARRKRRAPKSPASTDPAYNLSRFAVSTGLPDLAREHDHYTYGTPKRSPRKSGPKTSARKRA